MHDLQEHSGIIQVWMFQLMARITFGNEFIISVLLKKNNQNKNLCLTFQKVQLKDEINRPIKGSAKLISKPLWETNYILNALQDTQRC